MPVSAARHARSDKHLDNNETTRTSGRDDVQSGPVSGVVHDFGALLVSVWIGCNMAEENVQAEGRGGAPERLGTAPGVKVVVSVGVAPAGMPDVMLANGGTS